LRMAKMLIAAMQQISQYKIQYFTKRNITGK
jgi:hypothetical protein